MTILLCWLGVSVLALLAMAVLAERGPVTDEYDFNHDCRRFERPVPMMTLWLVRG